VPATTAKKLSRAYTTEVAIPRFTLAANGDNKSCFYVSRNSAQVNHRWILLPQIGKTNWF